MDDAEIWLRLLLVPRVGSAKLRSLYRHWGDSWSTLDCQRLQTAGLLAEQCHAFANPNVGRLTTAQRWLSIPGHRLLTLADADYPESLRSLNDAPPLLFIAGDVTLLKTPQLAMVGSRHHTSYGEQWGDYFANQFAASGLTITSGLAVGIDGICHHGALEAGGKTVAVLGNGLQNPYPRCHRHLAERIIDSGGLLVSEHLPDAPPLPAYFPQRNRVISGLSLGILVVEASLSSGSLITARHALEQGREVFALPGPLGSEHSNGCHQLIRQGAWLVSQPSDLLEVLHSSLRWLSLPETEPREDAWNSTVELTTIGQPMRQSAGTPNGQIARMPLSDVLEYVGDKTTPIDVVAERANQPLPDVLNKLIELELAGWITAVPGGYVQRKRTSHVRRLDVPV